MSDYNPGRDAALRHPDWVIRHRRLRGIPEVLCPQRKVILVETGLDAATRRCALAHAVAHIDLRHALSLDSVLEAREELAADRLAAERLVSPDDLRRIELFGRTFADVAAELSVTEATLRVRVQSLTDVDRAALAEASREEQVA